MPKPIAWSPTSEANAGIWGVVSGYYESEAQDLGSQQLGAIARQA